MLSVLKFLFWADSCHWARNANWTFDSSGQLWMEFLLTSSRCGPKTAWQLATGLDGMWAACAQAPSHKHLKVFFPLKDVYYICLYIDLSNCKGPTHAIGMERENCHSMYNTPENESTKLVGKYLLSRWKLRADASIINRTLPTCSSYPGWSCVPLGLQVILFSLFRNECLSKWTTSQQEFGTFRRWYWSLLSPLKFDELGNWLHTRGWLI